VDTLPQAVSSSPQFEWGTLPVGFILPLAVGLLRRSTQMSTYMLIDLLYPLAHHLEQLLPLHLQCLSTEQDGHGLSLYPPFHLGLETIIPALIIFQRPQDDFLGEELVQVGHVSLV